MRHPNLLGRFYNEPLFVTEDMARQVEIVLQRAEDGEELSDAQIKILVGEEALARQQMPGALYYQCADEKEFVAQIPLYGVLVNRGNLLSRASGMTSYLDFATAVREAADNPAVRAIVLDVDSPGGEVAGTGAACEAILYARERGVPVVAVANDMMASAAYLVACHADEVVVGDSSSVGSIGVVYAHREPEDTKTTYIKAGRAKTDGVEPLTPESKQRLQARIDEAYLQFIQKVADNRNLAVTSLTGEFQDGIADGSLYWGGKAMKLGLADSRGTIHDVLTALIEHEETQEQMIDETGNAEQTEAEALNAIFTAIEASETEEVVAAHALQEQLDRVLEENARLKAELEEVRADARLRDATDLVDAAIREGRIISGAREQMVVRAMQDYDGVLELLSLIPRGSVVPVGEEPIAAQAGRNEEIESLRRQVHKSLYGVRDEEE